MGKFTDEFLKVVFPNEPEQLALGMVTLADSVFESVTYFVDALEKQEKKFSDLIEKMSKTQGFYDYCADQEPEEN